MSDQSIESRIRSDLSDDCPVHCNDFSGPLIWAERPGLKILVPYVLPSDDPSANHFFASLSASQTISSMDICRQLRLDDDVSNKEPDVVEVLRKAWVIVREADRLAEEKIRREIVESAREGLKKDDYFMICCRISMTTLSTFTAGVCSWRQCLVFT